VAERSRIGDLLAVMARLRDPQNGCPWDVQQDFSTIAPYTVEEAYEVMDAIERNDPNAIRDELGDLLFQVVFHARMAEEKGWFDFEAVAGSIHDKLVRRHPHVFGDQRLKDAAQQTRQWEDLKAAERATRESPDTSALADVPRSLPALTRAAKLGRRAARVGFDWPDRIGAREKIAEELDELDAELQKLADARTEGAASTDAGASARTPADTAAAAEELGDLLFAVVNLSRHLQLDPEAALRAASAKFEQRFRRMEALAASRGLPLSSLSLEAWDALWVEAKGARKA
jgi:nucleoside triphosphate diphosphatase